MLALIRRHRVLSSLIAFIALMVTDVFISAPRGRFDAKVDIALGRYKVLGYGFPPQWRPTYVEKLKNRYNIGYETVALCIVSETAVQYYDNYNATMRAALQRKFGRDVIQESFDDAFREWVHTRFTGKPGDIPEFLFYGKTVKRGGLECFENLPPGARMYDLVNRCGQPDEEIGDKTYVFIYRMAGGTNISVNTSSLLQVGELVYTDGATQRKLR